MAFLGYEPALQSGLHGCAQIIALGEGMFRSEQGEARMIASGAHPGLRFRRRSSTKS
jgi:hypothetical protein